MMENVKEKQKLVKCGLMLPPLHILKMPGHCHEVVCECAFLNYMSSQYKETTELILGRCLTTIDSFEHDCVGHCLSPKICLMHILHVPFRQ